MTSFFVVWWKPVWFSKKVFLNFSSNLEDTLSRLEFSDPEISSNKFESICGFWNCHQFGRDHLLRVELYVVEFWRVYLYPPCARSATIRVPFQTSLPRTRRIRGVIRVILCTRIGGISIGQKKESDNNSNEPLVFFADSCNSSWNPSTVK